MEQIKAMFEEISKGGAFADEMQDLIAEGNPSGLVAAAAERGFVFTESDWNEYLEWSKSLSIKEHRNKELTPEELGGVVGGKGEAWAPVVGECWFHAGSEAEDRYLAMRIRCNQFACTALIRDCTEWHRCGCWGKHQCVNGWHYAHGCGDL